MRETVANPHEDNYLRVATAAARLDCHPQTIAGRIRRGELRAVRFGPRGERTIALGQRVAVELFEHRSRTPFQGEDEHVFCHPETGGVLDDKRYARTFRLALAKAKIDRPMRPFHDGRHTSITNAAAAGLSPAALMARAGHSDFSTTQLYIDLSGEAFRDEAQRLEDRLWGGASNEDHARQESRA